MAFALAAPCALVCIGGDHQGSADFGFAFGSQSVNAALAAGKAEARQ
jgi:hypothetical protein